VLGVQDVKTRRRARPLDRQQEVRPLGEETRRNGEARLVGEADGDAGGAEAEGVAPPPSKSQPYTLGGDAEERPSRERLPEHLRERPGDGEVAPYFVEPGEVARDGLVPALGQRQACVEAAEGGARLGVAGGGRPGRGERR